MTWTPPSPNSAALLRSADDDLGSAIDKVRLATEVGCEPECRFLAAAIDLPRGFLRMMNAPEARR